MKHAVVTGTVVIVTALVLTGLFAMAFVGGGGAPDWVDDDTGVDDETRGAGLDDAVGPDDPDTPDDATDDSPVAIETDGPAGEIDGPTGENVGPADEVPIVDFGPTAEPNPIDEATEDAVVAGVDEGIELAQEQGVDVTQEQRSAAIEGASESAAQHQQADAEQVQAATKGAVHGSLLGAQTVEVEGFQAAIGGSTDGALAQYQTVNATQMQHATWGAAHGGIAQHQVVEVEQIQVATRGAAAGAASEAGEKGVDRPGTIQEAAQGSAYGALEQYQKITIEQRQQITLEHVQHAAAGASAGALEGSTVIALEQDQRITIEQRQKVTVKQVQKAAIGAAKGALVQRQSVTVEQTQVAARGAGKGPLKQVQIAEIEQYQRITITQIQKASFGAAKGAIVQSQSATVEQIQAAADGASQGVLFQRQEVTITQVQTAATGAAKGSVTGAIQHQVVEVEQIQAAAFGAGDGAVTQKQVVSAIQVQKLAEGAAGGVLVQHQELTVEQTQIIASGVCQEIALAIQHQRISITQTQLIAQEAATAASAQAVEEGIDDETELVQLIEIEVVQTVEEIDELDGEASLRFADQEGDGETVVVDAIDLSEGGFVAIYDGDHADLGPDNVIGVSAYLEAGTHEDVEIELDEPLADDRSLTAAVHHDTTDDETFQYTDTDGEADEPYVAQGGAPVFDAAFYAVDVDEEPPEIEATLSVFDQESDGETLEIEEAFASVEYVLIAEYDDETVESETLDAGETVTELALELDPPIEADTSAEVSVIADADDDEQDVVAGELLATETIEYTLDEPDDAEVTLSVFDQDGDGETLLIEEASATVEYALVAEYDDEIVESEPFGADETVTDEVLDLEPPIEADTSVDVSVVATVDDEAQNVEAGETLVSETIEYVLEELEPEATLSVADQDGDGDTLVVEETTASVAYVVTASYDGEMVTSDTFEGDQTVQDLVLDLEPPIEADTDVDVAVYAVEDVYPQPLAVTDYGIDVEDAEDEYVTLQNTGGEEIDVTGWTLQDQFDEGVVDAQGFDAFSFPDGFVLIPGEEVTIVTGPGTDTEDTLHWGQESPVWDTDGDTVVVLDADGNVVLEQPIPIGPDLVADAEPLAQETIAYTLDAPDPEATLSVVDQEGDGQTLVVDEASATVEYALTVVDEAGTELGVTDPFAADETITDEPIDLDPPIDADATLEVSLVETDEGVVDPDAVLASETVEYTLVVEALDVAFLSCTQAEVSGTFQAGDPVVASTGFYDQAGFGNTIISDGVVFGENVDAPFTGTVVFEVGGDSGVVEGEDEITVTVPDYGTFGTAITGLTTDSADYDTAAVTHANPANCLAEIQPALPTIDYEDASASGDAIDVTFSYDNPNDAALPGGEFEGATADGPPAELDPGATDFSVEWTPATDDEQLTWTIDMTAYEYDEVLTAQTPQAGTIAPELFAEEEADDAIPDENGIDEDPVDEDPVDEDPVDEDPVDEDDGVIDQDDDIENGVDDDVGEESDGVAGDDTGDGGAEDTGIGDEDDAGADEGAASEEDEGEETNSSPDDAGNGAEEGDDDTPRIQLPT